ncbi:MAG: hypothetical protein Q4A72_07140 [Bacillota bacterium]|nr:hypothetical protein [Bacillota bacterium]
MKQLKKYIPALIFLSFLAGSVFASSRIEARHNEDLLAQSAMISKLQAELKEKGGEEAAETKKEEPPQDSGLNLDRVSQDREVSETFFKSILTWKTYEEYSRIREMLMENYAISEQDPMMAEFMPKVDESMFRGENLEYKAQDTYVTDIAASNYTYFSIVTVSSRGKSGGTADGKIGFLYSIDKDGRISNLSAHTLTD